MNQLIRSFLFVPANSKRKMEKSIDCGADAIILDLEDSVLAADKEEARKICAAFLNASRPDHAPAPWVRVNPLDSAVLDEDLDAIIAARPAGIMLPKPDGPVDIETLSAKITRLETKHGLPIGELKILPIITETARAIGSINLYPRTYLPRLFGLTWGAEDLSADLGASANRDENGEFFFVHQMSRANTLVAAKASSVQAIETLYADFRDPDGLRRFASRAFMEGFNGMMAIHPAQIDIINQCFMPSEAQIKHAHDVVDAFRQNPGAGAVNVKGKMTDIPHLKQAQYTIKMAKKFGQS